MFSISRNAAAAACVVATAMLSAPAMATPFDIDQQISGGGDNIFGSNGWKNVNVASPSDVGGVSAGAFALNATELGGDFIAWCLDIYDDVRPLGNYEITTTPFGDNTLSQSDLTDIQNLFNTGYSGVASDLTNANKSAGFQIALWEIAYEADGTAYDVGEGDFALSGSSGAHTFAGTLLGNLTGSATGNWNYDLTFLDPEYDNKQSLVTASVSAVPLPASALMLMGALAGLGLLSASRRRSGSAA